MAFIGKHNINKISTGTILHPANRFKLKNLDTGDIVILDKDNSNNNIGVIIRSHDIERSKMGDVYNIFSPYTNTIIFLSKYMWSQLNFDSYNDNLQYVRDNKFDITRIAKNAVSKSQIWDKEMVTSIISDIKKHLKK